MGRRKTDETNRTDIRHGNGSRERCKCDSAHSCRGGIYAKISRNRITPGNGINRPRIQASPK
jgi:hypothetical protein